MTLSTLVDNLARVLALILLVGISGMISAGETALFALSRQQLSRFRQSSRRLDQLVLRLREKPESLLAAVLLGNIAVNILIYSMLAVLVGRVGADSPLAGLLTGVGGFLAVILFAEILPKLVALAASERLAPLAAVPIRLLQIGSWPVRAVLHAALVEPLTRIVGGGPARVEPIRPEELQELVRISQGDGLVGEHESMLLHRVMDLAATRVSELMVPRVDVVAFDLADDRSELLRLFLTHRLLRIPVYEGQIDRIQGIIAARSLLLEPNAPLRRLIEPVQFIPEQAGVEALLRHFRATGSQLAMVVDEYGGLAGVVALEDVVEALVGELHAPDEGAVEPGLRRLSDRVYLVDAAEDLHDFCRAFGLVPGDLRVHTVGGLFVERLGRVPRPGDALRIGPLRFQVVSMRGHRVLQLRVEADTPPVDGPDLRHMLGEGPPPAERSPQAPGGRS